MSPPVLNKQEQKVMEYVWGGWGKRAYEPTERELKILEDRIKEERAKHVI